MEGKCMFFFSIALLISVRMSQGLKECPSIKRPVRGSKSCVGYDDNKVCSSQCLPGHKFKDHNGIKEVIHKCKDGKWVPSDKFPECIPDGSCMFDFEEPGYVRCSLNMQRKTCKITCGTKEERQFSCVNGKWDPPLPSCVKATRDVAKKSSQGEES